LLLSAQEVFYTKFVYACFEAFAAVHLRYSFFWNVTPHHRRMKTSSFVQLQWYWFPFCQVMTWI